MKILRRILIFSPLFLLSCDVPFFKVVSSSFAKEFCSCLFVVKQTETYCKAYAKQIVPVSKFSINQETKSVEAWGLGYSTQVSFLGDKEGCQILDNFNKLN
ncbi:MAG: hypothetical protein NXH75_16810 [Halobacteriovoraceae bacterium]|nr:hypothetical protein [Halobacteriovoraceae bacterium]